MPKTETDAIADQVATSLKKFLPDLGKPGGLASLPLRIAAPIGGDLFPNIKGPWACLEVTVQIYPEQPGNMV